MRVLDAAECKRWCTDRGIQSPDERRITFTSGPARECEIPLPAIGLKVLALSMALSQRVDGDRHPATLVWIVEQGMWSEAFEALGNHWWQRLLKAYEVEDPDWKSHAGALFDAAEKIDQDVFISLVMLFQWDAIVVPEHGRYAIQINHDGYVRLTTPDPVAASELASFAKDWQAS